MGDLHSALCAGAGRIHDSTANLFSQPLETLFDLARVSLTLDRDAGSGRRPLAIHRDDSFSAPRGSCLDLGQGINECFDKLGPWIVSCHAKDLAWDVEMSIHFREVRPGTSSLDYATCLRRLAVLECDAPLMLEHLPNAEEYDRARRYILQLGQDLGLSFSDGSGAPENNTFGTSCLWGTANP